MSPFNAIFLLASFLFIGLAFVRSVEEKAAANDLISDICSHTNKPAQCEAALRSDPGSAKADLKGLGHISIRVSKKSAQATLQLITALSKGGKDPSIKGTLAACSEYYDDSIGNLDDTESALNAGDYLSMSAHASAALDGPADCNDEFEKPTAEPPELKKASEDVEIRISALLVITNRLVGGGNN
ncbi:hypothetical protein LguiA_031304 [Lonicera macranthoides]